METLTALNTSNPQAIHYQTEELRFTILGGIRMDGLDRLRVTVKIEITERKFKHYLNNPELADLAVRHNIDLYNDTQVEKLIRKTAERLEVGTSTLAKSVADITAKLEEYRLQQIDQQKKTQEPQRKPLTEGQKEEAIRFLKSKNLMECTAEMIGRSGVIGEEANRLLMYIIFTSRKRDHPLHIISLGSSGAGKTYLQEKVAELIPEEDKIEITSLSDNAFYYFERNELSHKLILIEDYDGALGVLYPLRELKSKQRITKSVTIKDNRGSTKTIHLKVEGPVCIAGCTTRESLYEDNANRSFLIYLDESTEQDEKIMDYQRKRSAGKVNTEEERKTKNLLQNCQRILQPITIRNPYAEHLKIPTEVFKPRRTNSHYLQFIEAITFYHQYQRMWINEVTGEILYDPQVERSEIPIEAIAKHREEIYINTTIEDITEANKLMKEILLRKSDELTGACRNYFEQLKNFLQQEKQSTFTNKEIRHALRIPLSTTKRHNLELMNCGYLKLAENKKQKGYRYEVVSYEEYQKLQNKIITVLDEIVTHLREKVSPLGGDLEGAVQPSSSPSAQLTTEPGKQKKNNKLRNQPAKPMKEIKWSEINERHPDRSAHRDSQTK